MPSFQGCEIYLQDCFLDKKSRFRLASLTAIAPRLIKFIFLSAIAKNVV